MQNIKNVILDYGNVIYMIDFARVRQAFLDLGISQVDEFFGHRGQDSLFDAFDRGEITAAQFRDGVREKANRPDLTDQQIDDAWNSLLVGVPAGKHELLEQLHARYRMFLLSNNNEIHYAYCMNHIKEVYQVESNDQFFEKTYYSHLAGLRKPDLKIFELVLQENDLDPSETLFIDDSPQHLEGAKQLGIHTALCTREHPLEAIVNEFGLLK
ncbi:HAD family hydrolase [Sphingobacterium lactis]|uniref:HAD family hydrolase n=1 Tax=Sphingobacterium lactis TaxID=797291 RepID=UPI003F81D653